MNFATPQNPENPKLVEFLGHWMAIAKGEKDSKPDPGDLRIGFAALFGPGHGNHTLTGLVPTPESKPVLLNMASLAQAELFRIAMSVGAASEQEYRAVVGHLVTDNQVEAIARLCHEMNRLWCERIKDHATPPWHWDEAPAWQRESCIAGVRFHLANPDATDAASHENWLKDKAADGWTWGPVKDAQAKTHPCMVPFDQLSEEQQAKDAIFRQTVKAMLKGLGF